MDNKPAYYKGKNKKQATKPKTAKKRKSDGPMCSMFLAGLTRKLTLKKKHEEETTNIVSESFRPTVIIDPGLSIYNTLTNNNDIAETIIDSLTNALPVKFSCKSSPEKKESPMEIETLQTFAPELIPSDVICIRPPIITIDENDNTQLEIEVRKQPFQMPRMPLVSSDVIKKAIEKRRKITTMEDVAVNTGTEHDVAAELAKHVGTLKKISLIAEEFNQKTAKNLKEIVDSVQEDLIKKLEEVNAQRKAALKLDALASVQITEE